MEELDKKLKGLELEFLTGVPVSLTDEMIAQIKQAFADAGYMRKFETNADGEATIPADVTEFIVDTMAVRMSGREWYDRFQEELKPHPFSGLPTVDPLEAAKRASGIDE